MDKGIENVYIKSGSTKLNRKGERAQRTYKQEFYQLIEYKSDVDLSKKIKEWEDFYNFNRPHGAFKGKTPYEKLICLLKR